MLPWWYWNNKDLLKPFQVSVLILNANGQVLSTSRLLLAPWTAPAFDFSFFLFKAYKMGAGAIAQQGDIGLACSGTELNSRLLLGSHEHCQSET